VIVWQQINRNVNKFILTSTDIQIRMSTPHEIQALAVDWRIDFGESNFLSEKETLPCDLNF
jgi:hypothetical protein